MRVALLAVGLLLIPVPARAEDQLHVSDIQQRIASGQPTKIVCFGDSITGAYYHTGGQRAWCDMLGLALEQAHPNAILEMINAGSSGHTTVNALARIEKDVIAHKPHMVVVMFGMNDVTRVPLEDYADNMQSIVDRCQMVGAAVVLCTPNSVYDNEARPNSKLQIYSAAVRKLATKCNLPLVDCFEDYTEFRKQQPREWALLMSDEIHPNMLGHIRFAEQMTKVICGVDVSLKPTQPPLDALRHTFDRLSRGEAVKMIAMPPYDKIMPDVLQMEFPGAEFEVVTWPVDGQSVAQLSKWAQQIRSSSPHLVVPAIPLAEIRRSAGTEGIEAFVRDYEWVLNYSFQFSGRPWDVVPILPLEANDLKESEAATLSAARQIILGKDVRFIERTDDDTGTPQEIVSAWVQKQKQVWDESQKRLPAKDRRP